MPQILENTFSKTRSLKEVTLYFRHSQEGFAILWVIALMMAFTAFGIVLVSTYSVSLFGQLDAPLSAQAENLAESGYRFLYSELESQSTDEDRNELLDELHGKTFNISPDGKGGQFQLDITSYFYSVAAVTSGSELEVKFVGTPGFAVPDAGFLRNIEDATLYAYNSAPVVVGDVYTFTLAGGQTVPSTNVGTTVIPAAEIMGIDWVTPITIILSDSGQGALFPPEKGMFLITKKAIKANLPVTQIVPYTYEYRDENKLVGIDVGPGVGDFPIINAGEKAEVAKFVSLKSAGYTPDKANYRASEINDFNVSLDIAAASTWHSSTGLKSYWNFDDAVTPEKDDYGAHDGTLSGGGVTHTTAGKVGGALVFDGTDQLGTTFNPSAGIGNNQSFTVVFWAKPGADVDTKQGILGVYDSGGAYNFYIGLVNGHWEWGLGSQSDTCAAAGCTTDLPRVIPEEWQHVTFKYDQSTQKVIFYINGMDYNIVEADYSNRRKYEYTHPGPVALPSQNIYLGAVADSGESGFTGSLDEIAVFNTALNICVVREIYNVPCNVGCGVFNMGDDPGADPVAYYPYNGNANDESGTDKDGPYNNDGTVNNAVLTTDRFGCEDKAYSFNGSSAYIEVPHSDSLELSDVQKVTVGLWVKKDSNDNGKLGILQKSDQSYIMRYDDNWIAFIIDEQHGKQEAWAKDTQPVPLGVWHHLVGTYDGTNVRIYVDGVEETENPTTASRMGDATGHSVGIGENLDKTGRHVEGDIDDITIWDRVLTPGQILDYYNQATHKP